MFAVELAGHAGVSACNLLKLIYLMVPSVMCSSDTLLEARNASGKELGSVSSESHSETFLPVEKTALDSGGVAASQSIVMP